MKKARFYKYWNGMEWEIEVRAGAKGKGRVVASMKHWDNDKSEYQGWTTFYKELDTLGYELVS